MLAAFFLLLCIMHRTYGCIQYQKAFLHYAVYGKGGKVLLCFHGYGQTNEHFTTLEQVLGDEYVLYSFDLFYHGSSFWHEKDKPLRKDFLRELVERFLDEHHIDRFSVLGFSMGGKFALATVEAFAERVDKLVLIAPDGVTENFWYRLATSVPLFRKLFRSMVMRPKLYARLANFLHRAGLVNKHVIRFANTQMQSREQRRRVYYSWVVFKDLRFDMKKISETINQHHIGLELFLGEYDRIITLKQVRKLLDRVERYHLEVLPEGHSKLIEAVARYYAELYSGKRL